MASGKNQLQQHSPPSSVIVSGGGSGGGGSGGGGGGGGKEKQRLCTNCKNHGLFKVWKKHKRYCKYRDCQCAKCLKTAATRKNCAEQTAKRRARQEDEQREQELQRNPMNFENERPVPYGNAGGGATGGSFRPGHGTNNRHVPALVPALFPGSSSVTKISSSRTSEYDDSSSIDIDGSGVSEMKVDRHRDVDIDADSKPGLVKEQMEEVKNILKQLISRTKDYQNLNAFQLLILQQCTYNIDKTIDLIKRAHNDLQCMDMEKTAEKMDTIVRDSEMDEKPAVVLVPAVPTAAIVRHHHQPPTQPPEPHPVPPPPPPPPPTQIHHNRTGGGGLVVTDGGLVVTDFLRGDPLTSPTIVLDPGTMVGVAGARRPPLVNGTATTAITGGGAICGEGVGVGAGGGAVPGALHPQHRSVWHPRPVYRFSYPLTPATTMWHQPHPSFHAANATFAPFIESEWSRHCRLPIFNPELQPEPVNLHNDGAGRRGEPNSTRTLEFVERLQAAAAVAAAAVVHNRPQPVVPQPDDREPSRHHA